MRGIVVFMYHALYRTRAEREAIDPADRPYAVSVDVFEAQLDRLRASGVPVLAPEALCTESPQSGVVLTFDDGHASNRDYAFPALADRGLRALFFVTTDFIGRRPGFCGWTGLREMAEAGMVLGSHGRTHRFFDDLTDDEAGAELAHSRLAIERETGARVETLSFPGGRFRAGQLALARAAGYRRCFSSQVGVWRGGTAAAGSAVPRIPVRADTSIALYARYAAADPLLLARAQATYGLKRLARRMMGNRLYHAIYERFSV
ncbi:polysaccharide deacetylase [Sulfurifustis variabilis]|uniref:Polysaccharide deacetylase n=1 Tax=Sulfurifustis variabilis TaxID=1675686 RepID=A0A1B4V2Z0_9GAMM|nr:polysaccharide deacetylase family protein [Sulfurifustis variabilis]BAU47916.1 polysaccharide deacetylase [Sulfurifustis variabilis]